jgi:hypothetical protein
MNSPHPDNLTSAVFKALYREFDLITIGETYVVVPAGSLVFVSNSIGAIAVQISELQNPEVELDIIADAAGPLPQRFT